MDDYFVGGEIGRSGVQSDGSFFRFVPIPATPAAISTAGGNFMYWTVTAPLSVAINGGESLGLSISHANETGADFTAMLTGYLVST